MSDGHESSIEGLNWFYENIDLVTCIDPEKTLGKFNDLLRFFPISAQATLDSNNKITDEFDDTGDNSAPKIDWNDLKWVNAVGKRKDCIKMIYTVDEHQLYGKNRDLESGEAAYLCRLYHSKKCKSRLYMKDGRLYKKDGFVEHNHPSQAFEHSEFEIEKNIKNDCSNLDVLVNARTQSSAVTEIFDKHMKQYVWWIIIIYFDEYLF